MKLLYGLLVAGCLAALLTTPAQAGTCLPVRTWGVVTQVFSYRDAPRWHVTGYAYTPYGVGWFSVATLQRRYVGQIVRVTGCFDHGRIEQGVLR